MAPDLASFKGQVKQLNFFKNYNISSCKKIVITVINASAAVTLLEQRPEKIFRL